MLVETAVAFGLHGVGSGLAVVPGLLLLGFGLRLSTGTAILGDR